MIVAYLRLTRLALGLGFFLPAVTFAGSFFQFGVGDAGYWIVVAVLAAVGAGLSVASGRMLRRLGPAIGEMAAREAAFLDHLPGRWVPLAIAAAAGGSLALELAIIRWQGTVWEVFAFYKNFGLLSCFAGLGLGYALARRDQVPAPMTLPLLAFQMALLITLRGGTSLGLLGNMIASPILEQLNMGYPLATLKGLGQVYYFLSTVMLLTALAFIPVGQLCGRLLERTSQLRAYGLNLLGSLAGVALMLGLSFLWTPPVIWFVPCFAALVLLQAFDLRAVLVGLLASLAAVVALDWPVSTLYERIYSPYQLIERGPGDHGLAWLRAAGVYYQKIIDLSPKVQDAYEDLRLQARYYELPFRLHPHPGRVAIVGAGTGNDVAAALRMGAGHVDAIEIDPAIMTIGRAYHPERPYTDKRVTPVVNDARTFLRGTTNKYDLIVYALLDSHTLLSHASSVRLDSFVYTVEGLRDARARLKGNGVVSLSFCVITPEIGRKIYLMMQEAFDGKPPVCILSKYDMSVIFAQTNRGDLELDPAILGGTGFVDQSARYADPSILADVSTDDWPFFYMPRRVYPVSYVWMLLLILALTGVLFGNFVRERPRFSHAGYFFMGAGFMLVETKGITELGLMFGNTWQVIGIVIAAILAMAYLANLAVAAIGLRRPAVPLILVLASLGAGLAVAQNGGFPATAAGQAAAVLVLTCPMFFSGIAFSSLLARTGDISAALAMNLLGAMCGGLLEYNAMYFGFQFLYWIAMGLYAAAIVADLLVGRPS
jgi:spermidine synthase